MNGSPTTALRPAVLSQTSLARLLLGIALAATSVAAAGVVAKCSASLRYPGEALFTDGHQMAEMLHLRQGRAIYEPRDADRFHDAIYGPLYYWLGSRLLDPARPSYFPLRLVSLLATFIGLADAALLAFWITKNRWAAIRAPLGCMGAAVIAEHAVLARSDAVAAAVSFSGFLAAYRFRNSRLILLSTVPMLLAFFYKQVFIGAAVGVFVYLVLQKRHKVALQFAGLLAVGMLGGLALRQFVFFRGQAFLLHFIGYNLLPYEARGWTMGWVHFSLLLGIPAIAAWQFLRRRGDKLLACYTVCVTLIPLLAIGKAGGTINDYVECSFLLVTLLACEITQTDRTNLSRAVWVLLLIIALLVNRPLATRNASPADLGRDHAIQVFLRENFPPGTPALGYYTGDLTRAGLDTPINSLWHYVYLTRLGKLAGVALMRDIQCRRLGAIVLDFDLKPGRDDDIANFTLTPEYRAAILANYSLLGTLAMPPLEMSRSNEGEVFIWVPRWDVQELTRSPAGGK